jgi:hypothetical protein
MTGILLNIKNGSLGLGSLGRSENLLYSIWFWIAIIEFFVVLFLITKLLTKKKLDFDFYGLQKDKLKNAKSTSIDMNDLMNNINGSKDLYKNLSRACHPDKFLNTDMYKKAEEIFQEITLNKRNYKRLVELKNEAIRELQITIK